MKRTYNEFATELHQKENQSIFRVFTSFFKHTESPKLMLIIMLLRLSAAYTLPSYFT